MKNWASKLVHGLAIGTNSNTNLSGLTRVGVTQFWNGQTSVDIPLENYASKSSLENQICDLPSMKIRMKPYLQLALKS